MLFKCGGSNGGSTPTLISKNISANGTYNASDDNADGYSSVNVNVSGGGVAINTQAQWDALTLAQKRAQGLTVIKDSNTQPNGYWHDMSHAVIDIIKEFFNDTQETISMEPQSIYHLIYVQGQWNYSGGWDSTVINHSNITYDSVDTGNINAVYAGFNQKMVSILHDVTVGNSASITIRNGYGGVTDGGGVFAIPFNSTAELIGEHFGGTADSFTINTNYDFVLFISNKWAYGQDTSNGVYTIDAGTLIQTGDRRLDYAGSSDYATAVYENVPSGTHITLGNGKTGAQDSVVAIGIKEVQP